MAHALLDCVLNNTGPTVQALTQSFFFSFGDYHHHLMMKMKEDEEEKYH